MKSRGDRIYENPNYIRRWKYKSVAGCRRAAFLVSSSLTKTNFDRFPKQEKRCFRITFKLVGVTGFEPATLRPPDVYATGLRHTPN